MIFYIDVETNINELINFIENKMDWAKYLKGFILHEDFAVDFISASDKEIINLRVDRFTDNNGVRLKVQIEDSSQRLKEKNLFKKLGKIINSGIDTLNQYLVLNGNFDVPKNACKWEKDKGFTNSNENTEFITISYMDKNSEVVKE